LCCLFSRGTARFLTSLFCGYLFATFFFVPFFFLVILFFDDFIGLAVFLCDFFSVPLRFRGLFIGFFRADFLATGFCAAFFLVVRPAFLLPFFVVIFLPPSFLCRFFS
jgi:hypothetical protein